MLASIRPDSWNLPLFVHVFGAMVLVGGLLVAAASVLVSRGEIRLLRVGYLTLLAVALPGYVIMRGGAQWIYSKEHLDDAPTDPAWVGIGFITADVGALLLLIALILGGIGLWRLRGGGGTGFLRASLYLSVLLLAAYVVAVWAMARRIAPTSEPQNDHGPHTRGPAIGRQTQARRSPCSSACTHDDARFCGRCPVRFADMSLDTMTRSRRSIRHVVAGFRGCALRSRDPHSGSRDLQARAPTGTCPAPTA